MLTDLQLKKLPKMFVLNDNNGDGIIAQEDYEEAARVLARFRGLAPGTSEYEDMHRTIMSHWNHLRETCDTDGDNRVTLKEWLAYWDKVLATNRRVRASRQTLLRRCRPHVGSRWRRQDLTQGVHPVAQPMGG